MDKKNLRSLGSSLASLVGYTLPTLHKNGRWYIDFKALDPSTGILKRKKYYIKEGYSLRVKKALAGKMIALIMKKLDEGWTPWGKSDYSGSMVPFAECLDRYSAHASASNRKITRANYLSRLKILKEYNLQLEHPILIAYQFDTVFCSGFLDWIYLDRANSARTRNNYRNWLYGFAEFLVLRYNLPSNPVKFIGKLKEEDKRRKDMSDAMLEKLSVYLGKNDKSFYLACMMEYYSFLRPNELSFVRVGDINVKNMTVFVHKEYSKNGKDATVPLNKKIILLMLDLGVLSFPASYYVFSSGCKPGTKYIGADQFNKRWKEIRAALGWSSCFQFYSLKDSGIRDLANAEGIVVARDQARHSDISTTNKYVQQHAVHVCVKKFKGSL